MKKACASTPKTSPTAVAHNTLGIVPISSHSRVTKPAVPKPAPNIARAKGLTLMKSTPPSASAPKSSASPNSAPTRVTTANTKLVNTTPAYTMLSVPEAQNSCNMGLSLKTVTTKPLWESLFVGWFAGLLASRLTNEQTNKLGSCCKSGNHSSVTNSLYKEGISQRNQFR